MMMIMMMGSNLVVLSYQRMLFPPQVYAVSVYCPMACVMAMMIPDVKAIVHAVTELNGSGTKADRQQNQQQQQQQPISSETNSEDHQDDPRKHNHNDPDDDVLLVVTLDGTLAGISRLTGQTIWRRSANEYPKHWRSRQQARAEAPFFQPLVQTTTTTTTSTTTTTADTTGSSSSTTTTKMNGSTRMGRTSAVPSIDGTVHLTAPARDEYRHGYGENNDIPPPPPSADEDTEVTVTTILEDLIARVPFVDYRGRIYTGTTHSMAIAVDRWTGQIVQVVAPDAQCTADYSQQQLVWLGRTDQSISIHHSGVLDVQFSLAKIISVNDMLLGTGANTKSHDRKQTFLLPEEAHNQHAAVLISTPNGVLALLDPKSNRVVWVAHDVFDTPVAFGVDAATGSSLPVTVVSDAAIPHGSKEYLRREIERQLLVSRNPEYEQTIIGSLSNGQLYALPLGKGFKPPAESDDIMELDEPFRPQLSDSEEACNPEDTKCLQESQTSTDSGGSQQGAVVPFFHPEYGYIPPEHLYMLRPNNTERRRYSKLVRILGSWLPPTIALIFVISFELGRRKRLKDFQLSDSEANDHKLPSEGTTDQSLETSSIIQVYNEDILGYGAHGTVVFKGMLEGRQVAVKRMLKTYHASADREISLLIESDGHPNVVRYFLKELRGDFVYLALELCDMSLHDLINTLRSHNHDLQDKENSATFLRAVRNVLNQIACGVRHLHYLRIIHRDLKPANILLADSRTAKSRSRSQGQETAYDIFMNGHLVAKISDMGLGKQIVGQSSYGASLINDASFRGVSNGDKPSVAGAGPGSVGWQAPEVMALRISSDGSVRSEGAHLESASDSSLMENTLSSRSSRSVDIFSLGCIFYSTLVPGAHPFGEWYEREANIMHNKPMIDSLKDFSYEAYDLVSVMIHRNPACRPTAMQISEHPFFWSPDRRLSFLCEFSDRLEMESEGDAHVEKLVAIEKGAAMIVGTSWGRELDEELFSSVQKFRTYDPSSVRDLLRLIRNKYHHYDELSTDLKDKLRSKTEGLVLYFERRFPKLLIHCFRVCRDLLATGDPLSTKYCITSYDHRRNGVGNAISNCQAVETRSMVNCHVATMTIPIPIVSPPLDNIGVTQPVDAVDTAIFDTKAPRLDDHEHESVASAPIPVSIPDDSTERIDSMLRRNDVEDLVIWSGSTAATTFNCRGWIRSDDEWMRRVDISLRKRDANLVRCAEDPKFRTRLCNHWDTSYGTVCPMRKKNRCVFAHGPVELRVKETKRHRWGKLVDENGDNRNPNHSGGEDTYGAARMIETTRKQEGKWNTDTATLQQQATSSGPIKAKPKMAKKKSVSST